MNAATIERIKNEYIDIENDPLTDIGCDVYIEDDNNIQHWIGMFQGPEDSPYNRAFLYFTIDFDDNFPKTKPEVKFCYKDKYHLNVNPDDGHAYIRILNEWKPNTKIRQVLYAIFTILYDQNPKSRKSSYNSVMASLYEKNREEFNQNVREWVRNNALNIRK
jgi:ubiquitin-protein ligase